MPSPASPFKAAQESAIRGSAALTAAMGTAGKGILTEVPTNQPTPYVVLGDNQVLLENHDCAAEAEVFATVHVWSRTVPLDKGAQARAMGAALIAALNKQLTLAGWDVDEWELQDERYVTDPDNSTHAIITFHYLLTEQV